METISPTTPLQPTASSFKPLWRHVGLPAERGIELTHFLRQGLSVSVLDNIQEWSGMAKLNYCEYPALMSAILLDVKMLASPFNADESERIARLVRVFDAAVRLFNGDKHAASDWLNHPS
ncbi:toxin-antitoxin system antitoxin component [Providencia hangzhouensis]|uniref:toxin-antitoxin system antitoxin component n=1 Tax=Providencia hangzhouensis TaxID=3031799 RepID=UPI0034DDBBA6